MLFGFIAEIQTTLAFLLTLLIGHGTTAGAPVVALKYGVFQGAFDGNLSTFLGVPFAQPTLRFSLPRLPKALHGVQNATAFSPACPQQGMTELTLRSPIAPFVVPSMSDNCLKLNVFAPSTASSRSKLPVLVWIYGGGFEGGSSADVEVRPLVERSIATGKPIIVVTPNYRVSAWGFLAGKEVANEGITNLGLRDQIFALDWVQEHIAAFGGDPSRVVIGGVSAGAISSALLLLSNKRFEPTALFRGAFMLAGSPVSTGSVADGQPYYDELVAANNCTGSKDTLDCLRHIPLDAFKATVDETPNIFSFSSVQNVWRPRVDGDIIVRNPLVSVSKGLYAQIPILTGDADDEGTLFSLSSTNLTTNDEFLGYLHSNFFPKSTPAEIAELAALYPDDPTQGSPFDTGLANQLTPQFKRIAAFQGDFIFTGPRRFFLEHASKTQSAWSWLSKRGKSTPILGAAHGSDMDIWLPRTISNSTDLGPIDALLNFINTLDPNHPQAGARTNSKAFWPKWNAPSSNGSTSLLTLSDPGVSIKTEDFRVDAIKYLLDLLLKDAQANAEG
ncbi:Alpha/Beta hydrolase protein [Mycena albidolilacea]|uniref:Carboxylic ester hydrolase n=1 Tax=Mycena albidolilacea TaxID=1033008 RepID=A0AAD6ZCS6_9AGAR|nr:Alpha/Beta hydrolase protein [Mycena albidolilacea]